MDDLVNIAKSRGWCFTLNNYDAADEETIEGIARQAKYLIYGHEEAPTTKTKHLQGYLYMTNAIGLRNLHACLPKAHFEIARGTAVQNKKYCSKGSAIREFGELPRQGKRTDLDSVRDMVSQGDTMEKIAFEGPATLQALKYAETLMKYKRTRPREPVTIYWFYGPTGTGKTRTAVEMSGEDVWMSGRDLKFWDGYWGQKSVIIDDLRKETVTFPELLKILDVYNYRVNVKGSSQQLLATKIFITTPYTPEVTYAGVGEDIKQLLRRITEIWHFKISDTEVNKNDLEVGGNSIAPTSDDKHKTNIDDNADTRACVPIDDGSSTTDHT